MINQLFPNPLNRLTVYRWSATLWWMWALFLAFLTACSTGGSVTVESPDAVKPDTDPLLAVTAVPTPALTPMPTATSIEFIYNTALIDFVDVLTKEGTSAHDVNVRIRGNLRNGCESLYERNVTQSDQTITIELTTRQPVGRMCTEALVPFEETIPLTETLADLEGGHYEVVVNNAPPTPFDWSPDGAAPVKP